MPFMRCAINVEYYVDMIQSSWTLGTKQVILSLVLYHNILNNAFSHFCKHFSKLKFLIKSHEEMHRQ